MGAFLELPVASGTAVEKGELWGGIVLILLLETRDPSTLWCEPWPRT